MHYFLWPIVFVFAILLAMLQTGFADDFADEAKTRYQASVNRPYEDVVEDVEFAISEHNFRLTGGNRIGGAISERIEKPFPRSQIIHFCNLEYARQFLELAPDFLLHMPCKIVVFEQANQVVVEARLLPNDKRVSALTQKINQLLIDVVDYATEE